MPNSERAEPPKLPNAETAERRDGEEAEMLRTAELRNCRRPTRRRHSVFRPPAEIGVGQPRSLAASGFGSFAVSAFGSFGPRQFRSSAVSLFGSFHLAPPPNAFFFPCVTQGRREDSK